MQLMVTNDKDHLCTQVSYRLDLRGPSVVVQTTCSTSLVAVSLACESLHAGRCDMALAGGVTVRVPQRGGYFYTAGSILSPDGHCRPFDANAQGTIVGSGVGLVVLKRLGDALADGDNIRAVILGVGLNNDGNDKVGYTAPSFRGQAAAIRAAHAMAGVSPESIGYVEAHGTGTILGDPIEVAALDRGVQGQHRSTRVLRHRLGEIELRPSLLRRRRGRVDQDGARARARRHPADRALQRAESGDRLRVEPVLRHDAACSRGSATAHRAAPASARSASAAPMRMWCSRKRRRRPAPAERRSAPARRRCRHAATAALDDATTRLASAPAGAPGAGPGRRRLHAPRRTPRVSAPPRRSSPAATTATASDRGA